MGNKSVPVDFIKPKFFLGIENGKANLDNLPIPADNSFTGQINKLEVA
jgi:hypothetical protein